MGHMVGHYFANGGSEAYIVRVAGSGARKATATLVYSAPTPAPTPPPAPPPAPPPTPPSTPPPAPPPTLILDAASPGVWANAVGSEGLRAVVDHATANPNDTFNLTIQRRAVNPATGSVELTAEERHINLSMSPASPRSAKLILGDSALVEIDTENPEPTSTARGTSTGTTLAPGTTLETAHAITSGNNTLRVAVDFGPPVDLTIADGSYDRPGLNTAVEAAITAAGLAPVLESALVSDALVLQSIAESADSSVMVLPAPNDASAVCKLGLANGGTEVSGSAALRPTAVATPFTGGLPGSTVEPSDVVPSEAAGGIYSLGDLPFPRFNLLVLPGVTSANPQEVGAALAYCRGERAFLLVDTPDEKETPGSWVTNPPALGSIPAQGEHGAIYYPRLQVFETRPGGRRDELNLPPSGAIAGVYASTDRDRGVWKAPAGRGAGVGGISGLTTPTSDDLSGQLNPRGVNVLRSFPGAGTVVWGARTLRGDDNAASEFKYVPVRRITDYIASSLYLGTTFAVFEPNDPNLWSQLRLAVGTFMKRLFAQGAFQQSESRSEADSFFVTCDETVNPQPEIDLGRVNVVVGFAPLKPAEFVIITISQISALEE